MRQKKGFTLVELLVVIAIIGLLSTIAVVSITTARSKARDAKRVADMKQVITALEQYYNDVGSYPADIGANGTALGGGSGQANACGTGLLCTCLSSTNGWLNACAGTTYLGTVPTYPRPPAAAACSGVVATPGFVGNYCYYSGTLNTASTSYKISFPLENVNSSLGSTVNCITSQSGTTCSS